MELREKLVQLRVLAGQQRGLDRPMTQMEVAMALRVELGHPLSQAYLSQLERGKRVHLSNTSREALARFFQVHPGYLVSDLPDANLSLSAPGTLSNVPGLALAPDLASPIHMARQWNASSFPASQRQDVSAVSGQALLYTPPWANDLPPGKVAVRPVPSRSYPLHVSQDSWEPKMRPKQKHSRLGVDGRLEDLLSRLRDHPEIERVLVLVEQILYLPPPALSELEKLGNRLIAAAR